MKDPKLTDLRDHYDNGDALLWYNIHKDEFSKESDRASVILTSSIIEELLGKLLLCRLAPTPAASDELLDGANAPMSTFSSRISVCYRIGLISATLARDLNIVRRIRNEFAHNVIGANFSNRATTNRIGELAKSISGMMLKYRTKETAFGQGPRAEFGFATSCIIFVLNQKIVTVERLEAAPVEWIYSQGDASD